MLIGIDDSDVGYFRQIQSFPEEIDSYDDFDLAQSQILEDLEPIERIDLAVEVGDLHSIGSEILGKLLARFLGQRGYESPLSPFPDFCYIPHHIVYHEIHLRDLQQGVQQSGRTDDLLYDGR